MKKLEFVSIYEAYCIDELVKAYSLDDYEDCESMELFENDPDFLKYKHNEIRYVSYETEDTNYIIFDQYVSEYGYINQEIDVYEFMEQKEVILMFTDFYINDTDNFDLHFWGTHSTWDCLKNGIKYRGGSGYSYGIYEYMNVKTILTDLKEEQLRAIINEFVLNDLYDGEDERFENDITNFLEK